MSGRIVRVIPRRRYNFSDLVAGGEGDVILAQRIDVAEYDKVDLLVRIHELEIGEDVNGNGTGMFEVQVGSDGYTCEEPDHTFGVPIGAIVIDGTAEPGEFKAAQFGGPLGSMLMIVLSAKQDGSSQLALEGEFSIDIVLKS